MLEISYSCINPDGWQIPLTLATTGLARTSTTRKQRIGDKEYHKIPNLISRHCSWKDACKWCILYLLAHLLQALNLICLAVHSFSFLPIRTKSGRAQPMLSSTNSHTEIETITNVDCNVGQCGTRFFPPFKTFFSTKIHSHMAIWLTTALNKSTLLTNYLRSPPRSRSLWFHPKLTCQCIVSAACCREAAIELPLRLLLAAVIPIDDVNLKTNRATISNTLFPLKPGHNLHGQEKTRGPAPGQKSPLDQTILRTIFLRCPSQNNGLCNVVGH